MSDTLPELDVDGRSRWGFHWGWSVLLAAVTLVTLGFRYALPIRDGDIWWHMLYGKYFLENRTLIADHSIFSWTPAISDHIYVTWLPDIFFHLLHQAAGLPGLFVFRYLCVLVLVVACFLFARKLKVATHPLTWFLCLLAVIISYTAVFAKPEIFSYVFMILLVWNWWHIRSSGEDAWRHCYLFPVIMLIWVNSHGGFVFGAVFLVLIGLGELLNTRLVPANALPARVRRHLFPALGLAAFTILLTPYGYRYPWQLMHGLLPTQENISPLLAVSAYHSPFAYADTYLLTMGANLAIVLLLVLYLRNFRKIEWSSLLTNLVFVFLYTQFYRTTFYWVPVFLFSCLYLLALNPLVPPGKKYSPCLNRLQVPVIVLAGFLLAGYSTYLSATKPERSLWIGFGISELHSVTEAQYIKKYFPDRRIGNSYDQGAYLLWELWPDNKVFFDSRHFPFRGWDDQFFAFSMAENVEQFTDRYQTDLWFISLFHPDLIVTLLKTGEWKLAFYGRSAAVLVRQDIALPTDAPRISPDLFELKNLQNSLNLLSFIIDIRDWQTAEKVMAAVNSTFSPRFHRKTLHHANYSFQALKAFYSGDYQTAVRHFEAVEVHVSISRSLLAHAYHYLAREAWEEGKTPDALEYTKKAAMLTRDLYSAFNLGVIFWYIQETVGLRSENGEWRGALNSFLANAPAEPRFEPYRKTAVAILNGDYGGRPPLLTPPPPEQRSFF